jgi:hypothetical protein
MQPPEAFFQPQLSEFILLYESVRRAASPDSVLQAFLQSSWRQAAELEHWDLAELERMPG